MALAEQIPVAAEGVGTALGAAQAKEDLGLSKHGTALSSGSHHTQKPWLPCHRLPFSPGTQQQPFWLFRNPENTATNILGTGRSAAA